MTFGAAAVRPVWELRDIPHLLRQHGKAMKIRGIRMVALFWQMWYDMSSIDMGIGTWVPRIAQPPIS